MGCLMFSMDILTKEYADSDPVGEAQDQPNKDPLLKTPTAGRGLGDAIASVNILPDISGFSWNPFGKYLYFAIFAMVVAFILVVAYLFKN